MRHLAIILSSGAVACALPFSIQAAEPVMCTMQYDPVCASKNGVEHTYGNSCVAGAEGATFIHRGECGATDVAVQHNGSLLIQPGTLPAVSIDTTTSINAGTQPEPDITNNNANIEVQGDVATQNNQPEASEPARERSVLSRVWISISTWFSGLF